MMRWCWAPCCAVVLSAVTLAQHQPQSAVRGTAQFDKSVIVSGLANPWELAWGPDDMLWVTERSGRRITRVHPATGERGVALTLGEASATGGQDGVLGMALHPELLRGTGNDYVYRALSVHRGDGHARGSRGATGRPAGQR